MFYTSKKLAGMPVVSLADGHQLGRIKRLLIDQQKMAIAAFTVDRKGWFKEQPVIPYNHVKSVGNHAVTVDQAGAVMK
ncbi:MAG: PRC-barrel domain-containing protein, partial [Moorella sp. (in: Bacteria)]|nr:PRC-barrel domain-containing protein [Moorella sp. (in: firmicutes)]